MFEKRKWNKLREAIMRDNAGEVIKTSDQLTMQDTRGYYDICSFAIQNNKPNALQALLKNKSGFRFDSTSCEASRKLARQLIETALTSANPVRFLSVLYDANGIHASGRLESGDFFNESMPLALIQAQLEKNWSLSGVCIKANLHSTERLEAILDLVAELPNNQSALNNALVDAALTGNVEVAKVLLQRKADPNIDNGKALLCAGACGYREVVDLFLPLMKPRRCSGVAALLLQKDNVPEDIIASIEAVAAQKPAAAIEPQPQGAVSDGFSRLNDHTLVETQTLPDGSQMMDVFNFRTKRLKHIFRDAAAGRPVGHETVSFDKIALEVIADMRKVLDGLNEKKARPARSYADLKVI